MDDLGGSRTHLRLLWESFSMDPITNQSGRIVLRRLPYGMKASKETGVCFH